jgi:hypothetical protein
LGCSLHEDLLGFHLANNPSHFIPDARTLAVETIVGAGDTDVLARKALRNHINNSSPLERILELADNGMILIGGQALAFWTAYYDTPAPLIAITKDVDLLGTKADVERVGRGLDARAVFPRKSAVTLLVGQVLKDLPVGNYINIDVMSRVHGDITTKAIASRAVLAESPAAPSSLCIRSMSCRAASRTYTGYLPNRMSMVSGSS